MITVVLTSYYEDRLETVSRAIAILKQGSLKPQRIVLLNNNPTHELTDTDVIVLKASHNLGCGMRFALALGFNSDYYYFIDDDVIPKQNTLLNFSRYANQYASLGYCGKNVEPFRGYNEATAVRSCKEKTRVDCLVGVGSIFMSYESLLQGFTLYNRIRNKLPPDNGRESDLVMSMANDSHIVPYDDDSGVEEVVTGKGMRNEEQHAYKRDYAFAVIRSEKL